MNWAADSISLCVCVCVCETQMVVVLLAALRQGFTVQESSVSSKCLHKPTRPRSLNHFSDLKSNSSNTAAWSADVSFKHTFNNRELYRQPRVRQKTMWFKKLRFLFFFPTALFGWNNPLRHYGRCFPPLLLWCRPFSHSSPDKRNQN